MTWSPDPDDFDPDAEPAVLGLDKALIALAALRQRAVLGKKCRECAWWEPGDITATATGVPPGRCTHDDLPGQRRKVMAWSGGPACRRWVPR